MLFPIRTPVPRNTPFPPLHVYLIQQRMAEPYVRETRLAIVIMNKIQDIIDHSEILSFLYSTLQLPHRVITDRVDSITVFSTQEPKTCSSPSITASFSLTRFLLHRDEKSRINWARNWVARALLIPVTTTRHAIASRPRTFEALRIRSKAGTQLSLKIASHYSTYTS